jgi:integrase
VSLRKAVAAFLDKMKVRGLRPASITSAEDRLELLLRVSSNGTRPLRWLRDRGLELYEQAQADHAPDTHRNALATGKAFGKFCVKQRWLRSSPFEEVEGVGRRRRGKSQLGVDEARKLADTCLAAGPAPEPIAVLATLLLAPRASEVIERDVRDLDDGGRLLWIRDSKTAAGKRAVEIPELLQPLLVALSKDRIAGAPLFWTANGTRPSRHWVRDQCKRFCKLAGVPETTAHGLRGTHSSLARRGGATAELVAAQLGHAGVGVTNAAYIQRRAAKAADTSAVTAAIGKSEGNREPEPEPNPA